ncbi:hypothetical protein NMY22_g13752 [Coprinellus aureogranulatus]|nr:hypothetical protein NMY22_g13752 [Coprinellus aureogranulatus]
MPKGRSTSTGLWSDGEPLEAAVPPAFLKLDNPVSDLGKDEGGDDVDCILRFDQFTNRVVLVDDTGAAFFTIFATDLCPASDPKADDVRGEVSDVEGEFADEWAESSSVELDDIGDSAESEDENFDVALEFEHSAGAC